MGTPFDSRTCTVGSLLGENERRSVVLPRFQRGFSWEESHVERFWNDLIDFKQTSDAKPITASYFLGPIVLQPEEEELILLDGQQRLATATILLACIRDLTRELNTKETNGHLGSDLARDIQTTFIQKGDDEPPRYALRLGELDEIFFLQTVKSDTRSSPKPTLRSHRLIQGARNLLYGKLGETTKDLAMGQAIGTLRGIRDCLTKGVTMVQIDV